VRAFWKKNKKEDNDNDIDRDSDMREGEGERAEKNDAQQTPRISRSEYRKMQNAAERAITLADRKTAAKETFISIALKYILPSLIIYFAFIGYQYFTGNILVKLLGTSYFWILHILNLSFFVAVIFMALTHMFDRLLRFRKSFGAIAWFGSIYFYVTFLITNDARSPVLAAMILFVTGVIQLTSLNRHIKGSFILLGTFYGNYLTSIDFRNVWLVLGVGGLFVLMGEKGRINEMGTDPYK